jgi:hypothetical protein
MAAEVEIRQIISGAADQGYCRAGSKKPAKPLMAKSLL